MLHVNYEEKAQLSKYIRAYGRLWMAIIPDQNSSDYNQIKWKEHYYSLFLFSVFCIL